MQALRHRLHRLVQRGYVDVLRRELGGLHLILRLEHGFLLVELLRVLLRVLHLRLELRLEVGEHEGLRGCEGLLLDL
jgi:hypothetical protein